LRPKRHCVSGPGRSVSNAHRRKGPGPRLQSSPTPSTLPPSTTVATHLSSHPTPSIPASIRPARVAILSLLRSTPYSTCSWPLARRFRACPKLPQPSVFLASAPHISYLRRFTSSAPSIPSARLDVPRPSPPIFLIFGSRSARFSDQSRTMSGEAWLYLFAVLVNAVNLFLQVFFTIMYSDLEWYVSRMRLVTTDSTRNCLWRSGYSSH